MSHLRGRDHGVTSVEGRGAGGAVQIIFTIVPRRVADAIVELIRAFNPRAFYFIEELGFAEKGVLPLHRNWRVTGRGWSLRPFRRVKWGNMGLCTGSR
ncbi:MAG: DUF2179 domain-containing protein [Phycisphaerales bacterium]|nr:MAG: DUF2179 domain-containing protein [Phycisphaerales bacterium]